MSDRPQARRGEPAGYIGRPLERVEDARLLAGRGHYVGDGTVPGLLHAAILRSPIAHGRLVALDTRAALALPGVHAILAGDDVPRPVPKIAVRIAPLEGTDAFRQPVIAAERIRYVGEPLAIVLAESRAVAEDALELLAPEFEDLSPVASVAAGRAGASLLFPETGTNVAFHYRAGKGDPDAAFRDAAQVRRETFTIQRHTAIPMEPRGLLAIWDAERGHLTVRGAAKTPFFNRRQLAPMLGLEEAAVDLVELDVGGAFGVRGEFYPEDFLVPFAAMRTGRPVKWIEDRREHLMATAHSREMTCELAMAFSAEGDILALRAHVLGDLGAYLGPSGGIVATRAGQFLPGPYRIRNVAIEVEGVLTNKTPIGSYRGPGRFESCFFRERLLDMAARDLGIDPVEIRRRNLIREEEMPWPLGRLVPYEGEVTYDGGGYHTVLERCLEEIGWSEKAALQGALVDGRHHGLGVGCFLDSSGAGPKENARFEVDPAGRIVLAVGSSALGQGIVTAFGQIAADALGLTPDRFEIRHGSTTHLSEGFGSFHSRSMVMGGNAVVAAAERLKEVARAAGALRLNCAADETRYEGGRVIGPGGEAVDIFTLAAASPLSAEGSFGTKVKPFSAGAHAAHVAVDAETGHVEVIDYVAVEDVGRMINPAIVHGQKLGSIVQGLGGVFLEELVYDEEGQLLTGSLADYLLPTTTCFPNVRVVSLELNPTERNPLGVKGAGEDGIAVVAGVVGNAVAAALSGLGVEPTSLPLSPPRLHALVRAAEARRAASGAEPAS